MQHVATTISAEAIHIRYADAVNPTQAAEWIDVQIKRVDAKRASGTPIQELESLFLAELQVAALDHARQLIDLEIRRLKNTGR